MVQSLLRRFPPTTRIISVFLLHLYERIHRRVPGTGPPCSGIHRRHNHSYYPLPATKAKSYGKLSRQPVFYDNTVVNHSSRRVFLQGKFALKIRLNLQLLCNFGGKKRKDTCILLKRAQYDNFKLEREDQF